VDAVAGLAHVGDDLLGSWRIGWVATDLAKLDPRYIERREGDPDARLIVLVGVEGEDAKRLERLSEARGKNAAAVVSELLRELSAPPRSSIRSRSSTGAALRETGSPTHGTPAVRPTRECRCAS
jgi:hypothetical protein